MINGRSQGVISNGKNECVDGRKLKAFYIFNGENPKQSIEAFFYLFILLDTLLF